MDYQVIAIQRQMEYEDAQAENACQTAATKAGVDSASADLCDDGACCCPECPWKETASNWRKLRPLLWAMGS